MEELSLGKEQNEAEKKSELGKQEEGVKIDIADSVNDILHLKNPDLTKTVRVTDLVSDEQSISEIIGEQTNAEEGGISDAGFAVYALSDLDRNPKHLEKVKSYFEGKIVIDIGAGRNDSGYEVAKKLGCKAYIAVEPYYSKSLLREFSNTKDKDIPLAVTSDDALTFLKNVPDSSVTIMSFGTDEYMFRDREYNYKLGKEITRCLSKDGAFLSSESVLGPIAEDGEQEIKRDTVGRCVIFHF